MNHFRNIVTLGIYLNIFMVVLYYYVFYFIYYISLLPATSTWERVNKVHHNENVNEPTF